MPTSAGANRERRDRLAVAPPAGGSKQSILDAATRLFDEQGYDATSLRQIADAVGMTKAAVYYHYPAKEHLLLELLRPMIEALSELLTRLRTDGDSDAEAALTAYLDVFLDHLPVVHLMARDPATQNHPDVGQRLRALVDALKTLLAGPDATTGRTVRAACAMGVVHSVAALPPDVARKNRATILASAMAALDGGSEAVAPG